MSLRSFEEASRPLGGECTHQEIFDLSSAVRLLPLVRGVLADVVEHSAAAAHLQLARRRRETCDKSLSARERLLLDEKSAEHEIALAKLADELTELGVALLDGPSGTAGFPSIVNGRLAYLTARQEDDSIRFWRYRTSTTLRKIPRRWAKPVLVAEPNRPVEAPTLAAG
ncbi:MAG: DUF2203 family protein [Planctomycetia bacterium]